MKGTRANGRAATAGELDGERGSGALGKRGDDCRSAVGVEREHAQAACAGRGSRRRIWRLDWLSQSRRPRWKRQTRPCP